MFEEFRSLDQTHRWMFCALYLLYRREIEMNMNFIVDKAHDWGMLNLITMFNTKDGGVGEWEFCARTIRVLLD